MKNDLIPINESRCKGIGCRLRKKCNRFKQIEIDYEYPFRSEKYINFYINKPCLNQIKNGAK